MATNLFISSYEAGVDEVKFGTLTCDEARAALPLLERGLAPPATLHSED